MININIPTKPLSVNQVRQGKRFKTPIYKKYEQFVLGILPDASIPLDKKLYIYIEYYFSSSLCDIDNPNKPILDILSKKYGFNDRNIYKLYTEKFIVPKWQDKIYIEIREYETNKISKIMSNC